MAGLIWREEGRARGEKGKVSKWVELSPRTSWERTSANAVGGGTKERAERAAHSVGDVAVLLSSSRRNALSNVLIIPVLITSTCINYSAKPIKDWSNDTKNNAILMNYPQPRRTLNSSWNLKPNYQKLDFTRQMSIVTSPPSSWLAASPRYSPKVDMKYFKGH